MQQVKEIMIGFLIGIVVYAGVIELIGIFFSGDILAYTIGLGIGIGIAILLFFHMAMTLDKALDLSELQATKYMRRKSFFRLLIMFIALVLGLVVDQINFIALVLGILGCKMGALFSPFFLKKLYPESYITKATDTNDME